MSRNKDSVEQILDMLRQLLSVIKDESIPETEADKLVGRLLSKIDNTLQRMDSGLDLNPMSINKDDHIKNKIEIESPPLKSDKKTKPKAKPKAVKKTARKAPVKKGKK